MKEGNISCAQTIFVEDSGSGASCSTVKEAEKINGEPVVYKASKEAEIEEKRVRDINDEGDSNRRTKQIFNPKRPPKILKRIEKPEDHQPKQEKL